MRISKRKALAVAVLYLIVAALIVKAADYVSDRHRDNQLDRCTTIFRVLFPKDTEIIGFKDTSGFMSLDMNYCLAVRFPRSQLDSTILPDDKPMSTRSAACPTCMARRGTPPGGIPIRSAVSSREATSSKDVSMTSMLIDLDDPETVTAYLEYSDDRIWKLFYCSVALRLRPHGRVPCLPHNGGVAFRGCATYLPNSAAPCLTSPRAHP